MEQLPLGLVPTCSIDTDLFLSSLPWPVGPCLGWALSEFQLRVSTMTPRAGESKQTADSTSSGIREEQHCCSDCSPLLGLPKWSGGRTGRKNGGFFSSNTSVIDDHVTAYCWPNSLHCSFAASGSSRMGGKNVSCVMLPVIKYF